MSRLRILFHVVLLVLAAVVALPCDAQVAPAGPADHTTGLAALPDAKEPKHPAGRYNDVALYIAGMQLSEKCGLYSLTKNSTWQHYASVTNDTWGKFTKTRTKRICDWAQAEIPDIKKNCRTLFYPFSGPDYLYAHSFFPHAGTFILLGLEPVGSIPEPEKLQGKKLATFFRMLDKSISDALTFSFFKTNDMADEINHQLITGTVPVLMLFLARTGSLIADIRFFDLADNGTILYRYAGQKASADKEVARGVELTFSGNGDERLRKLIYISADISNRGLEHRRNVQAFLDCLENGLTTYLKSASYLMHKKKFSNIRSLILQKSSAVVQDDSAIPYRFFDKGAWDIRLYGTYSGPIDLFKEHFEKDLKDAYARDSKKLGFRLGYASRSNVLVARRISQPQQSTCAQ